MILFLKKNYYSHLKKNKEDIFICYSTETGPYGVSVDKAQD